MRTSTIAFLVVIYTGQKCKNMFGNKRGFGKRSKVDDEGRKYQRMMIFVTNFLCVFCATFNILYLFIFKDSFSKWVDYTTINWFLYYIMKVGNWQLLMAKMVPINLIMTTRVVKFLQGKRIRNSINKNKLEAAKRGQFIMGVPVGDVYNPDSNEDLGMVDYMFIDKTGTITNPELKVSKVHLGTYTFEQPVPFSIEEENAMDEEVRNPLLIQMLKETGQEGFKVREFLRCLAIVNNVEFEQDDQASLKATSPDELAFAQFAKLYGAELSNSQDKFNSRTIDEKFIEYDEDDEMDMDEPTAAEYNILFQFDFDHQRRRMSMLMNYVDERGDERVALFLKGALDVLEQRIDLAMSPDFEDILIKMEDDMDRGARTMFFCKREMSIKQLYKIFIKYFPELKKQRDLEKAALRKKKKKKKTGFSGLKNSMDVKKSKIDMEQIRSDLYDNMFVNFPFSRLNELREDLEQELTFLGATLCQEKLEEGIEHTLKFIRMANIKTWILTGDNLETTLGLCNKLKLVGRKADTRVVFKLDDLDEIKEENFVQLNEKIAKLKPGRTYGLAIGGEYFGKIQGYENTNKLLFKQFVDILLRCEIAIFAEMQPIQKKGVIAIVKEADPSKVTLAIGDGINDIDMLIEADIGVAILRSTQYSTCKFSDYYVQGFRDVKLLLFYYGRECYRRNSKLMLYMFFKNLLYVLSTFWAGSLNFYSGMALKPSIISNSFALMLTAFPMVFYGIYDKVYTKDEMLYSPIFYVTGKKRLYLNSKIFLKEMVLAVGLSCYLTFLCLLLFDWGNYKNGVFYGWYNFGNMISMGVVITVNLRIFLLANAFSFWNFVVIMLSIGSYFALWFLESSLSTSKLFNTFWEITATYQFYIYLIYNLSFSIMEYMIIKLNFYSIDKNYVPDFDVKFDAVTKTGSGQVNIEYSGVSNKDLQVPGNRGGSMDKYLDSEESTSSENEEMEQSDLIDNKRN